MAGRISTDSKESHVGSAADADDIIDKYAAEYELSSNGVTSMEMCADNIVGDAGVGQSIDAEDGYIAPDYLRPGDGPYGPGYRYLAGTAAEVDILNLPALSLDSLATDTDFLGHPGFAESLIPIWGSGREVYADAQEGNYLGAAVNGAMAVSDVFLVKSAVTAFGKLAVKGIAEISAKEIAESKATSPLMQKYLTEAGGRWGGTATRILNDQVAKDLESQGSRLPTVLVEVQKNGFLGPVVA